MEKKNELALIEPEDLSLVEDNSLNPKMLAQILKKTPPQYIKTRPAKGGGEWDYVSGGYVKKMLNLLFGWKWNFEITEHFIQHDEAIVLGRLECTGANGEKIIKMQFGNKDIVYRKQSEEDKKNGKPRIPLSIGNDLKAAATDALKKCASEIGIAADIYNKEEFREVKVDTDTVTLEDLKALYEVKKEACTEEEQIRIEEIIKDPKEAKIYKKIFKQLQSK